MRKRFYSILLIFALIISLVPVNTMSYASSIQDDYTVLRQKFDKLTEDDLIELLVAIPIIVGGENATYNDEIDEAISDLDTNAVQLLKDNGFIVEGSSPNAPIESVLEAARNIVYGKYDNGNGKRLSTLITDLKDYYTYDDVKQEQVKKDVLKAYDYIFEACPDIFKEKDFSKYGSSKTDKLKTLIDLAKAVFTTGDELVKYTTDGVGFILPTNYIEDAKEHLNITLEYEDKTYEDAIKVFLNILSQKINTTGQSGTIIKIAEKMEILKPLGLGEPIKIVEGTPLTFNGGIKLDLGELTIPDGAKVTVNQSKQTPSQDSGLEKAGDIMEFSFEGITINKLIELTLTLNDGVDSSKAGIFYLNNGEWEYQDTDVVDGKLVAKVNHFSTYGVLIDKEKPTTPNVNVSSISSNSATITLSSDDNAKVDKYKVYNSTTSKETNTSTLTIPGLSSNTSYEYKAVAVDKAGNISDEATVQFTTNKSTNSGGGESPSGGGGSPSDETDDKDNENKESDDKTVEGTIKDADVKQEGNETIAKIKEETLTKEVENVVKEAKEENTERIQVNIDLSETVKGKNVEISLPVKSLKELEGKEANIVIKTKEIEVNISVEDLDLENEKAQIKLDTKEVEKEEVKNIDTNEGENVAKVIEINLTKVEGDNSTKIDSKFKKKVKVGIDISDIKINKEKSVVVRINDNNTEIVGGKIKDGKIYANLEHFSKYAVVERNVTFEDINNHWSKQEVESMASKGIINGYDEKTFNPDKNITRAEFAKLIVNELELDLVKSKSKFKDMGSHWAKDYVNTAYKAGLIKGYDGNFNPNDNITRAQMATMIGRAIDTDKKADIKLFDDNLSIPEWSKENLSKTVAEGFIKGNNGLFRPNDNATRAEATAVIYRMYNK